GDCLVGCRVGAANTLTKNYLWFAEKRGAQIHAEREVVDVTPIGAADGRDGYRVTTQRPGAWFRRDRQTHTARGVVVAGGAAGRSRRARARSRQRDGTGRPAPRPVPDDAVAGRLESTHDDDAGHPATRQRHRVPGEEATDRPRLSPFDASGPPEAAGSHVHRS